MTFTPNIPSGNRESSSLSTAAAQVVLDIETLEEAFMAEGLLEGDSEYGLDFALLRAEKDSIQALLDYGDFPTEILSNHVKQATKKLLDITARAKSELEEAVETTVTSETQDVNHAAAEALFSQSLEQLISDRFELIKLRSDRVYSIFNRVLHDNELHPESLRILQNKMTSEFSPVLSQVGDIIHERKKQFPNETKLHALSLGENKIGEFEDMFISELGEHLSRREVQAISHNRVDSLTFNCKSLLRRHEEIKAAGLLSSQHQLQADLLVTHMLSPHIDEMEALDDAALVTEFHPHLRQLEASFEQIRQMIERVHQHVQG